MTLSALSPQPLWSIFEELSAIPRPSGQEEAALQFLEKRLSAAGVENWRDSGGNLMMRKAASSGCEKAPAIVLQSHIDMVAQKGDGVDHDFEKDGLNLKIEDGWVMADGTTLGADNGIGVATILAVMESNDIKHGPLEGLVTIDEERGLTGAQNLEAGVLQGDILLNLDSEDEGELFIGCAGGVELEATLATKTTSVPARLAFYEVCLGGLYGGHSGLDIHRGRANAIQLLARFLGMQQHRLKIGLASIDGGTLMNAIPRHARAVVGVPMRFAEEFDLAFEDFVAETVRQYRETDPNMNWTSKRLSDAPDQMINDDCAKKLIALLRNCPSTALRMSPQSSGVTETSNNLAVVKTAVNKVQISCMARSLITSAQDDLMEALSDLFIMAGAEVQKGASFSGWTPNPDSAVLMKASQTYQNLFGTAPKTNVIHAGLECGLLGQAYPGWDMVSFGPTIRGAHSPQERVEIESVGRFWEYFQALLSVLADE